MNVGGFTFPQRVLTYMAPGDPALARARAERYPGRMASEWATIAPYVRADITLDILDIGCGLGGIDVMIARHRSVDSITLIDGTGDIAKRGKINFKPDQEAWADVRVARDFVTENTRVCLVSADTPDNLLRAAMTCKVMQMSGFDLIVSLRSWGHHYPASVYAKAAHIFLSAGGRAILDIRRGTGGRQEMEAVGFRFVAICDEGKKHQRMVFER